MLGCLVYLLTWLDAQRPLPRAHLLSPLLISILAAPGLQRYISPSLQLALHVTLGRSLSLFVPMTLLSCHGQVRRLDGAQRRTAGCRHIEAS